MAFESFGFGQDVLVTTAPLDRIPYNVDRNAVVLRLTTSTPFPPKLQSRWRFSTFSLRDKVERRHLMSVKYVSTNTTL
jgi:hypothetical protein